MTPLYFGTSERPLFGVYHPPKGEVMRSTGILLCYPFGHEYMRAHRAFRQLSMLLSRQGYHVFRFDYFGTGDSGGANNEGNIEHWLEDIEVAIEEIKDTAAVESVALIGLRLGASLASMVAPRRDDVTHVVMWDPVVNGGEYLQELLDGRCEWDGGYGQDIAAASNGQPVTVHGFALTERLQKDFSGLDLVTQIEAGDADVSVVVARDLPRYRALEESVSAKYGKVDFECIPAPDNWNEVDDYGSVLLPQQVIQGIVARFA